MSFKKQDDSYSGIFSFDYDDGDEDWQARISDSNYLNLDVMGCGGNVCMACAVSGGSVYILRVHKSGDN